MKKKFLAFVLSLALCLSMSVTAMADYVSGVVQATVEGKEVDVEVYEYTGEECSIVDILWYLENFADMTLSSDDLSDCRDFGLYFGEGYVMPEGGVQITIKDENISADKNYVMVGFYWEQAGPDAAWDCFGKSVPVTVTNGAISGTFTLPKLDEVFFVELKSEGSGVGDSSSDDSNTGEDIEDSTNNNTDNNTNDNINTDDTIDENWMEEIEPADLRLEDGKWLYYNEDGVFDEEKYAYVSFNDGVFLVANGVVAQKNGLSIDPNSTNWYFVSNGQVQTQKTGLVTYDGEWFYVNTGRLNTSLKGYVEYDGGLFYVAAGQIKREVNGLAQDPNGSDWYYLANGQVQTQYTGLAKYDGEWFYIENGALAENYTGNVTYDGAVFYVENGMVK